MNMLSPKKTKYRKQFKGRIHGNSKGNYQLNYGSFGLKAIEPERVTSMQVKSLVTSPNRGQSFTDCPVSIRGKAWTGTGNISKVEISLDEGKSWHSANLEHNSEPRHWTSWECILRKA